MTKLIREEDILKYAHDVTLANGAKHRCFDVTLLSELPDAEAIPIEYIEAKKKTLKCLIEVEVKHGDMEEASRLEKIIAVMNGLISDWRYDARLKRRWERGYE